jgi:HK97 family phage major capsid protein
MSSIQNLRERHASLAKQAREFLDVNEGNWKPEHTEKWDSLDAELNDLEQAIKRREAMAEREAEDGEIINAMEHVDRVAHKTKSPDRLDAFKAWLKTGEVNAEMSTNVPSEGGYTVPTFVADRWIDALKAFGGMRQVSTILSTDNGNEINYPTSDGTSEEGEILAENAQAGLLDPKFGMVALNTYKYSSKQVAVPIELLQDAAFNMEEFVDGRLIIRLGRITNRHFTVGTGDKQPQGILTAAALGKTAGDKDLSYDDLIDLQHSVDYAYRESSQCAFMMHDQTVAAVRKIRDAYGRPIFVPGYQFEITNTMVNTLLGVPVVVNNNMDPIGPGIKSILFGDFSRYIIRDCRTLSMLRMTDSYFATKGQVGFLILSRHGGNYVDAGGAVKYLEMPSSAPTARK